MLLITVPSSGQSKLKFSNFEDFSLPSPPGGVDAEINDDLVLKFEDEEEAIVYAEQLEDISNSLNDKALTQKSAINDIIMAIYNDEFIQSYLK
jgi:hypothetical protein